VVRLKTAILLCILAVLLLAGCAIGGGETEAGATTVVVSTETVMVATTGQSTTTGEATTTDAGEFRGGAFKSPSRNIGCLAYLGPTNKPIMTCSLRELDTEPPASPHKCPYTTYPGDSFHLFGRGRGHWTCSRPSKFGEPSDMILRYGRLWERRPFTCRSLPIGVRCWNLDGHGFFLSRERQKLF
jgi:hypothetical protein